MQATINQDLATWASMNSIALYAQKLLWTRTNAINAESCSAKYASQIGYQRTQLPSAPTDVTVK